MWDDAHSAYLESRVLSADPLELVNLLYQACISQVREARRHLAEGDIGGRSHAITRAGDMLAELTTSLDLERGGEIARRLAGLYGYMQQRLLEANLHQSDGPLEETLALLVTLGEAWEEIGKNQPAPPPAVETWAEPAYDEPVESVHAWSF